MWCKYDRLFSIYSFLLYFYFTCFHDIQIYREWKKSSVYIYTIPLVLAITFLKHGPHILPNQCLSSLPAGIKPLASLGHIE